MSYLCQEDVELPKCMSCKFFARTTHHTEGMYDGICRRFPPQAWDTSHVRTRTFSYPEVDEHNLSCGEYEERVGE